MKLGRLCVATWMILCGLFVHAKEAVADGDVTLAEVLPAFADSEHAAVFVAPAPSPGAVRVVRRGEIKRALASVGIDDRKVRIPRRVRVRRQTRRVRGETFLSEFRRAVESLIGDCEIETLRPPPSLLVGGRSPHFEAEPMRTPLRTGHRSIAVRVTAGGRSQRVIVGARLQCPPPLVSANSSVRIVVQVGAVRASAPGRARQPGRLGEIVRVVNTATGASLMARVIDADTVEAVR